MVSSSGAEHRKTRRAFVWIAIVAVTLAALLTVAWYVLAGRLDAAVRQSVSRMADRGVVTDCADQAVFGYPFRLGLSCARVAVDAPGAGLRASGGALKTAAQIYRPNQVVAELAGPLAIDAAGFPPMEMRWSLAQASASFWTQGLDRVSLAIDEPVIALGETSALVPLARSERLETHARRREDSLDLAVVDRGVKLLAPSLASLPTFDVGADATIDDAAGWLSGTAAGLTLGEALAGKSGTIRSLRVAIAGGEAAATQEASGSVDVSGPFSIDAQRQVSGQFDLVVSDAPAIAALVSALAPDLAGIAGSVASGIAFAGRTENGRTTVRIDVDQGNASLGVIPLGSIPPLP